MIRLRLIAWNAIVFAATLALIGVVVLLTHRAELNRGVDEDLSKRALYLIQTWKRPPADQPRGPRPPASSYLSAAKLLDPIQARRLEFVAHLAMPRIFSMEGKSMGPPNETPFDQKALTRAFSGKREYTTILVDEHPVRILTVPLKHAGRVAQVAQFATDLEGVDSAVAHLTAILLTMLPLALVVTCLLGYWSTHRALQPVTQIAEATERIEAVNLAGRLPVIGNDEFSYLAGRFNSMLARLEQSFRQLAQTNEAQRQFIADASHELKTPLTAVKGRVGVALAGPQTVQRYTEHIQAIGRAADGMAAIVADLLLLAQSDEGKLVARKEPCLLAKVVKEVADERVQIEIPWSMVVSADPTLLQRAFANLLANALRHTPAPGKITVRAAPLKSFLKVEVEDEGEGIPAEHLPKLFDRFHRVDPSRDRESGGTGLGLSIVRSIVHAHGGRIDVASELGCGTKVSLYLPLS